jgi:hypothetical protein
MLGGDYSSKFSAWLAHGCISPRYIHSEVRRAFVSPSLFLIFCLGFILSCLGFILFCFILFCLDFILFCLGFPLLPALLSASFGIPLSGFLGGSLIVQEGGRQPKTISHRGLCDQVEIGFFLSLKCIVVDGPPQYEVEGSQLELRPTQITHLKRGAHCFSLSSVLGRTAFVLWRRLGWCYKRRSA